MMKADFTNHIFARIVIIVCGHIDVFREMMKSYE